jgi:hypothetical protein
MSLRYKFKKADTVLRHLDPHEKANLQAICARIQAAEEELLVAAEAKIVTCIQGCEGLCCRNARIDDIIGLMDCVYILTVAPGLRERIDACLGNESPIYSADCIFLENGRGPCIFPFNARPEVCITTFCGRTASINAEIGRLKRKFMKLGWFVASRKPRAWARRLFRHRKRRV